MQAVAQREAKQAKGRCVRHEGRAQAAGINAGSSRPLPPALAAASWFPTTNANRVLCGTMPTHERWRSGRPHMKSARGCGQVPEHSIGAIE